MQQKMLANTFTLNDYLEQIKSDFTDDEMAEIINALAVYNGERINFIDNKINKIK